MRPADVLTAFTLLTRLPLGRFQRAGNTPDLARSVWAFPLVGLVVGAAAGVSYWLAYRIGMPPLLAAAWTLVVSLLLTGALHEDGLADVADGFGGGRTPARKLEIMRDSRIGSYGALALLVSLLVRVSAIVALGNPRAVWIALILAAMLGRASILVLLMGLQPARMDGLAASLSDIPAGSTGLGLLLALFASLVCLPATVALATVLVTLVTCLAVAAMARAQIGGHTGDVLGCGEMTAECVALTALACGLAT